MKNDNWIMGILALFVVFAFFGGYYIGASEMSVDIDIDMNNNSLDALEKAIESQKDSYCNYEMIIYEGNKSITSNVRNGFCSSNFAIISTPFIPKDGEVYTTRLIKTLQE